MKRSCRFIGMTSYMTFPAIDEGVVADYARLCEGWCHCFRDPDRYLAPDAPRVLISESDFLDYDAVSPSNHGGPGENFDFVYVCLPGRWAEGTKNWTLAKRCLQRLCADLDLKGLLVGRWQILDLPFKRNLTVVGDVRRHRLLNLLSRSRLLFVPSVMDASPRILAEALCLDVAVLVNRQILGGWKYVTEATGAFFDSEDDVCDAAQRCLQGSLEPRLWFREHHGPALSSARLGGFLEGLDRSLTPGAASFLTRSALAGGH
jgi:hypothetical protein